MRRDLDDWDPDEVAPLKALEDARQEKLRAGKLVGPPDEILTAVAREQGFDGLPEVAPADVVDGIVAQGGIELFRGISAYYEGEAEQRAEAFRTGEYFAGTGVNGSGTYTGVRQKTAEGYLGLSTGSSSMLRMALRPDARVIERKALDDLIRDWNRRDRASINAGIGVFGPRQALYVDPGRAAAALGYDAIYVDFSTSERAGVAWDYSDPDFDASHYVVLNRTAVVVQDTDPRFG